MVGPAAGRTLREWLRDQRGALGAAQIFGIAGAVVAVGLGGALVTNADFFEQRIQRTTMDSVDNLALGLGFGGVIGFVENGGVAGPQVTRLHVGVRAADGAEVVDLRLIVVRATDGESLVTYALRNESAPSTRPGFTVQAALDEDESLANATLTRGDVADLVFDLKAAGLSLGPRDEVTLRFQAGSGPVMRVEVQAPSSLGGDSVVSLERDVRRGE